MAVKRVLPVVVRLGTLFLLFCFVACSGSGGGGGETSGSRAQLTAITIDPVNPSIANGTTVQLTATGIYSNKTTKDLTTMVDWSSADSTIAQVSNTSGSNGLVTAASVGQTAISAQLGTIQSSTTLTSTSATLTSVDVVPESVIVGKGTQIQLQALGTFSDGTTQVVTQLAVWSSGDATIATVDDTSAKGLASGVNIGSTTITANVNGAIGTANIQVTAATLDSITINPVDPAVAKGTSLQLTATGNFSDGTTEDLTQSVTWASSNDGTATVSDTSPTKGLATAVKVGAATISATLGSIQGSTTFTVDAARLKSITIDPADASVAKGTSLQLTATGEFTDHTTEDLTGQVSWMSEDEGIAQVSNASGTKGLSTGIAAGSTTVSATFDGVEGKTTITVTPATLISITVAPANPTIAEGTNVQLTATGNFSDSSTEDLTDQASWTSSDETVAQVSNQGLVSGIAAGSALITATVESVGGSTTVTVTTATLSSITLAPLNPSVAKGTTVQLTATGHFSDGSTEDLTNEVSWSSNDDTIAQVGDDSDTQGLVTGIAAGSTTIVATLGGIQGSTGITVTPAVLLRIRIQPSNPTLRVHDKLQLTAIAEFSDGTTQDVTRSTCWESSNPKVAHVISSSSHTNGRLQAIKVGRATITATFKGVEGSTLVTVTP